MYACEDWESDCSSTLRVHSDEGLHELFTKIRPWSHLIHSGVGVCELKRI